MSMSPDYVEENARELERMRALVERLDDDGLRAQVNERWTVADALAHIAFWDARQLALAEKLERGVPFTPSDDEPEDVDWINDSVHRFIQAIEPRAAARLSLRLAEETDSKMAAVPPDRTWPADPASPLNPLRATHRGEHLDDIEAALRGS